MLMVLIVGAIELLVGVRITRELLPAGLDTQPHSVHCKLLSSTPAAQLCSSLMQAKPPACRVPRSQGVRVAPAVHQPRLIIMAAHGRQGAELAPKAAAEQHQWATIEETVGKTPLVRLQRLGRSLGHTPGSSNILLCKLEGNNPAGSVKDRPALSMIKEAEAAGVIRPGDTLIEATSGNTGIALAMAAAMKGYKMKLIMPRSMSAERAASMTAYGAELIGIDGGMEDARDLAIAMQARGEGKVLDQFANPDNPLAHLRTTGPELWSQTGGKITHLVASMGTTGTIMGTSCYLKSLNPNIQIVGLQPADGSQIPGIRRWPKEYLPAIFQEQRVDSVMDVTQREAELMTRGLARTEGILAGISSGGVVSAALRLAAQVDNAVIAMIICDRGDRYLSTGIYSPEAGASDPLPCGPQQLWSSVQTLTAGFPGPHYVLFLGQDAPPGSSKQPEVSGPWCSQSQGVAQELRKTVAQHGGTLLEVHVGSQVEWQDPQHPLKTHPRLQLRMLPALIQWKPDGSGPAKRASGELSVLQGLVLNRQTASPVPQ